MALTRPSVPPSTVPWVQRLGARKQGRRRGAFGAAQLQTPKGVDSEEGPAFATAAATETATRPRPARAQEAQAAAMPPAEPLQTDQGAGR